MPDAAGNFKGIRVPRLPDSMRRRPELQGKISLLDESGPNRAKTDEAQRAYEIDQEDRRIRASKLPASMEKAQRDCEEHPINFELGIAALKNARPAEEWERTDGPGWPE